MAGLSLVEHFQGLSETAIAAPESNWNPEKLKQTLSSVLSETPKIGSPPSICYPRPLADFASKGHCWSLQQEHLLRLKSVLVNCVVS